MGGRRTALALVAAVLWLAGVALVPTLPLALHASLAAHTHDGDTTVFTPHHHADGSEHRVVMRAGHRVHARAAHDLALELEHGAFLFAFFVVVLLFVPAPHLVLFLFV